MLVHDLFRTGAIVPLGLALVYAFGVGFRDSSALVATVVSTRTLSPSAAFLTCAVFEFIGAFVVGSAIAQMLGRRLIPVVAAPAEGFIFICAALVAMLFWSGVSWWRAWPTSNNHALIAALWGAGLCLQGGVAERDRAVLSAVAVLVASPFLGFLSAVVFTRLARWLGEWMTPRVKPAVASLQVVGAWMLALAHGSNDGQMLLLLILGALSIVGISDRDMVRDGTFFRCLVAVSLALGVTLGGRRILRRLGLSFYRIRPPEGLGAQIASTSTIFGCAFLGFPASSTQVITGSILGAGAVRNPRAVRWNLAQGIVFAWFLTIPAVAALSYALCASLLRLFP